MPSRRRSRIKSISGNISDVQKRLRYLETRPAPAQLARKVVATQNIALRAVVPDVVADAAIVRRTLAPEAVISANLSVVGDVDDAAVATENIQLEAVDTPQVADLAITNEKLAGDIADDKITSVSASKVGPDLLQDDQLDGMSTSKLIGDVLDTQIDSVSASKIGPDLIQDDQLDGISTSKFIGTVSSDQIDSVDAATITVGLIMDDQIDGISGEKIIGGIDGALIVSGSIPEYSFEEDVIGTYELKPDAVFNENIYPNSVYGREAVDGQSSILFGSINKNDLAAYAVGALEIEDLAIERRHLNDDVIISRMINNGAVQTAGIGNLQVTNAKIADGTITSAKIADNTITSGKISTGSYGTIVVGGLTVSSPLVKSTVTGGPAAGDAFVSISVGTGSTQVAAGDHTHSGGTTVPGHTHPFTITQDGSNTTGAASAGTAHTHNYGRATGGTVGTNSTIRVKKEISEYKPLDISKLLNLKLMKYKYKNEYRHLHPNREWMYGYMAEDLIENDFEEVIGYDKDGLPDTVNYGLISIFVLELVKKHQNEIDSLKEEIQRLKEAK